MTAETFAGLTQQRKEPSLAGALAALFATGRLGIGIGLLAAPQIVGRSWMGDEVDRAIARMAVRSIGARDLALGAGLLLARRDARRRWLDAGLIADAADLAGTLVAWRHLPATGRAATLAMAAGAIAMALRLRQDAR